MNDIVNIDNREARDSTKEPEDEGDELDERFDMKTIKKQINEIVEKANG